MTAKPKPPGSPAKPTDLPCSQEELHRLYARLRILYFTTPQGQCVLPPPELVRVEWSHRITASAGLCYPAKRLIRLSTHYHARFPEDVEATLLHEMIHLIVPGHGPAFQAWLKLINERGGRVARYAKARAKPRQNPRWLYRCVQCGARIPRYRRLAGGGRNHRHKACGGRLAEARLAP